ncbi:MAG: methyltransferase domain-containing protein [Gammaproteobacteria bacterium]|nr:methyltransferase domain-containing protein [Gammaproteobacteria bacterium]
MRVKDTLAAEFDQFSDSYTEDIVRIVPHYLRLLSSLSEGLPDNFSAANILDLGCGNGNVTALLRKKYPDAEYTLLDASADMLAICRERLSGINMNCVRSYFRDYTFPEDYFDLIAANFSLHHLDSVEKQWIFPLLCKSLKQGGIFTCADMMVNKNSAEHTRLVGEWRKFINASYPDGEKWAWMAEHHDAYDWPDDYTDQKSWLHSAGFRRVDTNWRTGYWVSFSAVK